jgi:hypothetical protein
MCETIVVIVGCHYSNAERNSIIIRILNAFQWAFILMYFPSIALSHRGKIRIVRNTFPITVSSLTVTATCKYWNKLTNMKPYDQMQSVPRNVEPTCYHRRLFRVVTISIYAATAACCRSWFQVKWSYLYFIYIYIFIYRHFKINYTYVQLRTRQYTPEDSELHTDRRENLKSHTV